MDTRFQTGICQDGVFKPMGLNYERKSTLCRDVFINTTIPTFCHSSTEICLEVTDAYPKQQKISQWYMTKHDAPHAALQDDHSYALESCRFLISNPNKCTGELLWPPQVVSTLPNNTLWPSMISWQVQAIPCTNQ